MKANNIAELAKLASDNGCQFSTDQLEAIEAEYMQIDEHWGWKFSDGSCGLWQ